MVTAANKYLLKAKWVEPETEIRIGVRRVRVKAGQVGWTEIETLP